MVPVGSAVTHAPVVAEETLSGASQHGIALVRLQGYEPDSEDLAMLAALDSGEITSDEAEARIIARYTRV